MFAALVNRPDSKINLTSHAQAIKAAALLTNQAWFSPYDYGHIIHNRILVEGSKKLPFKFKLTFISTALERWEHDAEKKGFVNDFKKLQHILKQYKSIKHPPPSIIREMKSMERNIEELYMQLSAIKSDELSDTFGLIPLEPLLKESFFGFLDYNGQEELSYEDFTVHSIKEIMKLQLKKKTEVPILFVLSGSLPTQENHFPEYCSIDDKRSSDKNQSWFEKGIDCTGFKSINDTDFIALNMNISKAGIAFNEAMHRWIEATQKDSLNFDDVSFYKTEVAHLAEQFSDAITNDIIMLPYKEHPYRFRMQIGAMPLKEIWKHYYHANCISEKELEELIEETKNDPAFMGRWPVMSIGIFNREGRKYELDELLNIVTELNPPKRKVIDLD